MGHLKHLLRILKRLWLAVVVVSAGVSIIPLVLEAIGIKVSALYALTVTGVIIIIVAVRSYINSIRKENENLMEENQALSQRLREITSSFPNIELYGKPYVDKRPIYDTAQGIKVIHGEPFFAHVRFRNNPKIRSADARAKSVIAEITFFDSEGKNEVLEPFYGRWGSSTKQPSYLEQGTPLRELCAVDFEESGLYHELDIALKYPAEDSCYAYDNESYYYGGEWKKPDFELQGEQFQVRVKLIGQMVDKEWRFILQNLGKGQSLKIEVSGEAIDWQASLIGKSV